MSATPRAALRQQLLQAQRQFVAAPSSAAAQEALSHHLRELVATLEPQTLGVYAPVHSEFNAAAALIADPRFDALPLALPFARRTPRELHYRAWNRAEPTLRDECAIPASDGAPVVPDVVLIPCVGHTAEGLRLGYGGGYYDRWLAAHEHVTAIGIAWSVTRIDATQFGAQPHDRPMMLIVTELGTIG